MKYNWDLIAWIGECDADHGDHEVEHLLEPTTPAAKSCRKSTMR